MPTLNQITELFHKYGWNRVSVPKKGAMPGFVYFQSADGSGMQPVKRDGTLPHGRDMATLEHHLKHFTPRQQNPLFDRYTVRTSDNSASKKGILTVFGAEHAAKGLAKKYPCVGVEIVSEKFGSVIKSYKASAGSGTMKVDQDNSKDYKQQEKAAGKFVLEIDVTGHGEWQEHRTFDGASAKRDAEMEGKRIQKKEGMRWRVKEVKENPTGSQYTAMYLRSNMNRGLGKGLTINSFLQYELRGAAKKYAGGYANALAKDLEREVKAGRALRSRSHSGGTAYYPTGHEENPLQGKNRVKEVMENPGNRNFSAWDAKTLLESLTGGGPPWPDYHTLDSTAVDDLVNAPELKFYRKPKTASGSRGRYLYEYLQKLAKSGRFENPRGARDAGPIHLKESPRHPGYYIADTVQDQRRLSIIGWATASITDRVMDALISSASEVGYDVSVPVKNGNGQEYIELNGGACDDCIIAIANDDYTGMDDRQEAATRKGIHKYAGKGQHLVVGDELGFESSRCAVCGGLAGNRHEVGYLQPKQSENPQRGGSWYVVYWKSASTGRSGWVRIPATSARTARERFSHTHPGAPLDSVVQDVEKSPFQGHQSQEYGTAQQNPSFPSFPGSHSDELIDGSGLRLYPDPPAGPDHTFTRTQLPPRVIALDALPAHADVLVQGKGRALVRVVIFGDTLWGWVDTDRLRGKGRMGRKSSSTLQNPQRPEYEIYNTSTGDKYIHGLSVFYSRKAAQDRIAYLKASYPGTRFHLGVRPATDVRSNPEPGNSDAAAELFTQFHGAEPTTEMIYADEMEVPDAYTELGDLIELWVIPIHARNGKATQIKAPDPDKAKPGNVVKLTSSPDGKQLHFVGGDQGLDLKALGFSEDEERHNMLIGVLVELTYRTKKGFHKFKKIDYFHKLGEEDGNEPVLTYDPFNEKMSVAGGNYKVLDVGIVN